MRAAATACAMLAAATFAAGAEPAVHEGLSAPAQAWAKALEAGDLAALARMYGRDALSYPPDKPQVRGPNAIKADYAALLEKYDVRVTDEGSYWMQSGPLVVSWGRTELTLHPKAGGADIVSHSRYTDAATKVDGGWRYVVDHASAMPRR